jgi:hypothetical protein
MFSHLPVAVCCIYPAMGILGVPGHFLPMLSAAEGNIGRHLYNIEPYRPDSSRFFNLYGPLRTIATISYQMTGHHHTTGNCAGITALNRLAGSGMVPSIYPQSRLEKAKQERIHHAKPLDNGQYHRLYPVCCKSLGAW